MNGKLTVENNRVVYINRFYQLLTYGGLLEGLPTEDLNTRILEEACYNAKKQSGYDALFVIEPTSTPIPYEGKYPVGTPMALPKIICVADLSAAQPARDMNKDVSALTILWFQNDFAFPIDPNILQKIKEIPWSELAWDFDY